MDPVVMKLALASWGRGGLGILLSWARCRYELDARVSGSS